jgi:hypothetical protein
MGTNVSEEPAASFLMIENDSSILMIKAAS